MKNLVFHPDPLNLSNMNSAGSPNTLPVVITTEDRIGTIARIALVTLVSILVGAAFILVVRMTAIAEPIHHLALLAAAGLMSLGVQVFLAPWLVRTLGRRGTWTVNQHGIAWQPRLGRRQFLLWSEVESVRFHPMTVQVRGTHRRQRTTITLGSGLLSLDEWQRLRQTIARQLCDRFVELDSGFNDISSAQRWTRDPRVVHLGALGFLTAMTVFAAILSLNEDLNWPGYAIATIAGVRIVGWVIGQVRTPWHQPRPTDHQSPRLAA